MTHRIDKAVKKTARFFQLTAAHFSKDRGFVLASGMAYSTLFSIVPFFAFITLLLSRSKWIDLSLIRNWINGTLLPTVVPSTQEAFIQLLDKFIQNAAAFGWISLFVSLLSATLLIKKINDTFNAIYRALPHRKIFTRLAGYLSVMVIGSFVVGFAFTLLQPLLVWLSELEPNPALPLSGLLASKIIPWSLFFGILLLIFKTTPSTYVQWSSALLATATTTVGWLTTNEFFGKVINLVFHYEKIYGSMASVFFFLLWIYVLWVILFFALEMAYVHQYREKERCQTIAGWLADGLRCLRFLCEAAAPDAPPCPIQKITRRLPLPNSEIHRHLQLLAQSGILIRKKRLPLAYSLSPHYKEASVSDWIKNEIGEAPNDPCGKQLNEWLQMSLRQGEPKTLNDLLFSEGGLQPPQTDDGTSRLKKING